MRARYVSLLFALVSCGDAILRAPPVQREAPGPAFEGGTIDAGIDAPDAASDAPDARADAPVQTGCPALVPVGTRNVPRGFLPVQRVTLAHTTDGDTATFLVSSGGTEVTVRFLFVNTEESFGAEATEWGTVVKNIVGGYIRTARELHIAVREDSQNPGQPDLDPFKRALGLVFTDGELVQSRIVREGLSPYYVAFGCATEPVHTNLLHSEAEAYANQRGVWRPNHPKDYRAVMDQWIGNRTCRPNPYKRAYCP